jgi:hypothetical protein
MRHADVRVSAKEDTSLDYGRRKEMSRRREKEPASEPCSIRTTRPAAGDRAIGDRLNDEKAGMLAALLGKLHKSEHDDP